MPKLTVYMPDEVTEVLKKYKKPFNISEICQQAIRNEIQKRTELLIISQNARLAHMNIPPHAVLRVNVAWIKNREELFRVLSGITNDVFLDFPEGRRKPPRPVLKFPDLIEAMRLHKRVKYFGATDVRNEETVARLLKALPPNVQLIPKIESRAGVKRLELIAEALPYDTKYIMLDKEDLYTDLGSDNDTFLDYLQMVREKCWKSHVHVLELAGVIFVSDMLAPQKVTQGGRANVE